MGAKRPLFHMHYNLDGKVAILPSGESGERAFRGNIFPELLPVRLCPCPMVRFGAASFYFLVVWYRSVGEQDLPT